VTASCRGGDAVVTDPVGRPFDGPSAVANSNYSAYGGGRLIHPHGATVPTKLTAFVHDELRAHVDDAWTCPFHTRDVASGNNDDNDHGDETKN
jgi:hypothetical protein